MWGNKDSKNQPWGLVNKKLLGPRFHCRSIRESQSQLREVSCHLQSAPKSHWLVADVWWKMSRTSRRFPCKSQTSFSQTSATTRSHIAMCLRFFSSDDASRMAFPQILKRSFPLKRCRRENSLFASPSDCRSHGSGKDHLGRFSLCWLSWFSGPGCCSCPGVHLRFRASDCSPGLAFCFMGPWTFAWMWCPRLPYDQCKQRTAHVFTAQGGTRRMETSHLGASRRFCDFSGGWKSPPKLRKACANFYLLSCDDRGRNGHSETPKRVRNCWCAKMTSFESPPRTCHFENHRFWYPFVWCWVAAEVREILVHSTRHLVHSAPDSTGSSWPFQKPPGDMLRLWMSCQVQVVSPPLLWRPSEP